MDDEILDESEVLETTDTVEETDEAPTPEEIAEWKEKAAKADDLEEKNKQLFERAKKAETKPKTEGLSGNDALALMSAQVHAEDVEKVIEWAKFKKIPVSEALKDTFLQTVLNTASEERRTAEATHTTASARGTNKISGEDLLKKAETTGEVPETSEGMEALFMARLARKQNKQPQRR